jgi:SAM-dependent methyltransferase
MHRCRFAEKWINTHADGAKYGDNSTDRVTTNEGARGRGCKMDLSMRSTLQEELGDDTTDPVTYQRCMSELAVVNRITFTHRPTLNWLAQATRTLPPGQSFSVLDVGYGDGDLLRAIARWARRRGLTVQLSGIDSDPRSAGAARAATPADMAIDYQTCDVFSYVPIERPDFIVSSHLTHHLSDEEVVEFLLWLEENSLMGWHIADLQRHAMAYHGFPILTHLMGWHRIVRDDGTISIARGFRRHEWQGYLEKACLRADVSWRMTFRLCVSRLKAAAVVRQTWWKSPPRVPAAASAAPSRCSVATSPGSEPVSLPISIA